MINKGKNFILTPVDEISFANYVVFGLLTILHKNTILLPSGWVRIKLLPRVMEKILISCDGKKFLPLWPSATRVRIFNHHVR